MTEGIQISPQGAEVGALSVGNVIRKFLGKTSAPTVNDDITEGYIVSDMWLDETNDIIYQCLDNTDGAAVWNQLISDVTLIDDSMADVLHRHSELSGSDGTPNPALSVDADGKVGIGIIPSSALHVKSGTPGTIGSHPAGQIIIQNPAQSMWSNAVITAYESDGDGNPDQQLWYLGSAAGNNSDILFLNRRSSNLKLGTSGIIQVTIDHVGNVSMSKSKLTAIGGFAILLTNETGVNTIAGQLVDADIATDDAVTLAEAGDTECIGVFLDDGIADGAEAWVVVAGTADVAFDDNVSAVRGNWVATGVAPGYARTQASPAASPQHFDEIGHSIESVAATGGGTHILARCVLHFN